MLEQGRDFWRWFDTTQFSYHCVHPIHAKMFSIQMLLHFSQIVPKVQLYKFCCKCYKNVHNSSITLYNTLSLCPSRSLTPDILTSRPSVGLTCCSPCARKLGPAAAVFELLLVGLFCYSYVVKVGSFLFFLVFLEGRE